MSIFIRNIGELTTNDPSIGDGTVMGRLHNAAIMICEGRVVWVGNNDTELEADEYIDAEGAAVIPGFVDSHTHLVFCGERSDEFETRMAGKRYDGGGIMRTVDATRAASREVLNHETSLRAEELRASGVTTMEIKSGYALNVQGEQRLLEIAASFSDEVTFLGAHVVPQEFVVNREAYIALVIGEMLNNAKSIAKWADVFCDNGAFSVDEARRILSAAREAGLGLRLHGNQFGEGGAVALAVEMDCASVDHCTYVSDNDLKLLASSNTVATLLPGAEFSTKSPYPSGRRFLDAGVTVALATDCNPGTSYVTSMPLVVALAVREMNMTVDEALWAATAGGAAALRRSDIGTLSLGARGDLVILNAPRAAHLAYRPGGNVVRTVLRSAR